MIVAREEIKFDTENEQDLGRKGEKVVVEILLQVTVKDHWRT